MSKFKWLKLLKYKRGEPVSVRVTPSRVLVLILSAALAVACTTAIAENPQAIEQVQQDAIMKHYETVQPLPVFNGKSQIRQNLIEIEEANAAGVQTTSFECAGLDGCDPTHKPMKTCASVGAPIPVTDELSNPDQPLRDNSDPLDNGGGNVVVGNMDPDGIYHGEGSGTYVRCIGANGAVIPAYWEGNVEVEYAPAEWVQGQGIVDIGPPSFQFSR